MAENENECGGAIVHNRGCLSPCQNGERRLEKAGALAPLAAVEIEFQIVVLAGYFPQRIADRERQRSAAEIRMNDDAGAIDDRLDAAARKTLQSPADTRRRILKLRRFPAGRRFGAHRRDFLPNQM